jgi:hypothetical protein
MMSRIKIGLLWIFTGMLLITSCKRVVIRIDEIPGNTPKGQPLYVAGNFNNWDPGDQTYQMTLNPDSSYTFRLPPGFGSVEYKITRGDWTTVETDICGYEISNRILVLRNEDTATISIESWNDLDPLDCPRLTIVVKNIPENTPGSDSITLAGNFNSWNPDEASVLRKDSSGRYSLTISRPSNVKDVEFKITRGNLSTSESDEFGNVRLNRTATFGEQDTIVVAVEGWVDLPVPKSNRIEFICKKIPANTPAGEEIILVSNMNGWDPNDRNFSMRKNPEGLFAFSMPRKDYYLEYKFTRGGWHTVETDLYGFDIDNRQVYLNGNDTVLVEIKGWKDLPNSLDRDVTIIITDVPPQTPAEDNLYLAGNFNGWDPNRTKFKFEKTPGNRYILNIPREKYEMEFKVTRGSWKTQEVDQNGVEIPNRRYQYKDYDTLYIYVVNWKDKPRTDRKSVTLIIDKLPANTPGSSSFFIAGTFNDWDPNNRKYIFSGPEGGRYAITLPLNEDYIEFKITRGGWRTCEVDKNGWDIPNRALNLGFADTVHISIEGWKDR